MQLSGFLDIALTLVAAFVLTSLLCTTLNELVATLLKTRARTLHRTVFALIDDDDVRQAFFRHGLITSLATGSSSGKNSTLPSYMDGRTFADALLAALSPDAPIPGASELEARLATLPPGKLRDALTEAAASATRGATDVRKEIALWFDSAMDRLSGYYTRYMKWLSLGLGMLVAVGLNIDAVDLATASWNERVRNAALTIVEQHEFPPACAEDEHKLNCLMTNLVGTGERLGGLPIGWGNLPPGNEQSVAWWLSKLVGWIITALAASVGAPFWFDVLQNVMSLRGAGTKREEPGTQPAAK